MSTAIGIATRRARDAAATPGRARIAREQILMAAAQLSAGVGNLAFALVAAHVLAPRAFAQLAAFLGLYLLVHVPASSLTAGTALDPGLAARRRRRVLQVGGAIGAALALGAYPLSGPAGVPAAMLLALAVAVPAAGWLALERGRLYGHSRHERVALSLGAEPIVRLAIGVPAMLAIGAVGGAIGVVIGGIVALAVTRPRLARANSLAGAGPSAAGDDGASTPRAGHATWTALAFLALAVVQNQDVVLGNALLGADAAGRFAVLSTIGGVAAFATTTVPLVLLPRAARGERHALSAAVTAATLLGLAAIAVVAIVPDGAIGAAFGDRYASVSTLVVPYVTAMGLFGVARVLVAHGSALGGGRTLAAITGAVAAGQALAILLAGDDPLAIAGITLAATSALAVAVGTRTVAAALPATRAWAIRAVVAMSAVALVVRLLHARGIWLDEATSITQAQMPLGDLLSTLRTTDVHPPLHHLILWVLAHSAGIGELTMRLPSILAGTLLVPVLYALGRELYDERAALMAAALGTVAPFLVWYSQEARMYALFMLFTSLALLGQLRAIRRGGRGDWVLYAGATVLMLWTQYFGIFFALAQQLVFAIAWRRRRWRRAPLRPYARAWIIASAAIAVAVLPLSGFAIDQFQANQAAGRGFDAPRQAGDVAGGHDLPGVYAAITNGLWALVGYHADRTMAALSALWPLGMLFALLMLGRRTQPRTKYVVICAVGPAVALFAIGFLKPFLFEIRYFAGIAPLLLLLVARGATGWARGAAATAVASVVLVGGLSVATADQQLNGSNPRVYDFEGALARIERRAHPGDLVLYEPFYLDDVVNYYAPRLRSMPLRQGLEKARGDRTVFVLGSFQDHRSHRQATRAGVKRLGRHFRLAGHMRLPQIQVWVFKPKPKSKSKPRPAAASGKRRPKGGRR